jgi:type VI secretion system secreted protein VgrG
VPLRKVSKDFVVQAPTIVLGGAVGKFHAAGSSIDLNGGPVVLKGSKIIIEADAIVKLAADLKIG